MLFVFPEVLKKPTGENWVSQMWNVFGSLFFVETPVQVWEVTEKSSGIFWTCLVLSLSFQEALNMDSTAQSNDSDDQRDQASFYCHSL